MKCKRLKQFQTCHYEALNSRRPNPCKSLLIYPAKKFAPPPAVLFIRPTIAPLVKISTIRPDSNLKRPRSILRISTNQPNERHFEQKCPQPAALYLPLRPQIAQGAQIPYRITAKPNSTSNACRPGSSRNRIAGRARTRVTSERRVCSRPDRRPPSAHHAHARAAPQWRSRSWLSGSEKREEARAEGCLEDVRLRNPSTEGSPFFLSLAPRTSSEEGTMSSPRNGPITPRPRGPIALTRL